MHFLGLATKAYQAVSGVCRLGYLDDSLIYSHLVVIKRPQHRDVVLVDAFVVAFVPFRDRPQSRVLVWDISILRHYGTASLESRLLVTGVPRRT